MKLRSKPKPLLAKGRIVQKAKGGSPMGRIDPSRTQALRRQFVAEMRRRFKRIRGRLIKLLTEEDAVGLATNRWKFNTSAEKLSEFKAWVRGQTQLELTGADDRALWRKYTEAGFKKGAGRAFDDVKKPYVKKYSKQSPELIEEVTKQSKEVFLRSSFGRPVAKEKVELLASRSFDDLVNVTEDMATRMGRTLADGLVEGKSPYDVASDLSDDLDISQARAETIARTEIIRAHAEGQLDSLEQMGVAEVGVMVEWATAGPPYYSEL